MGGTRSRTFSCIFGHTATPPFSRTVTLAQFFKQKSSRASRQVCRPGAEQANKQVYVLIYKISLSA
jgi:hypothetical protein